MEGTARRLAASGDEALAIGLKRLAYRNLLSELYLMFGRHSSTLSIVHPHIAHTFGHLLRDLTAHSWLKPDQLDVLAVRRKALLLHSFGLEGQWIFVSLPPSSDASATVPPAAAAKTTEDSGNTSPALSAYVQAVAVLTQHLASASDVVVERHKFRRRVKQPGQSILEYVAALRELATRCSFAVLVDSLRNEF
ncbi:hypothetical protein HPB47_018220 [Ixodes persulcatus]|uniref:Uncharacterized protein n=1 Tax=Ixodes persulcatus TaxID=34615 RepID=A0AC60QNA9_IXOPE|nr:hypothetical protein HPB47_018220 [Ixodes persulcatus]